jgi:signal transduction histidine kinase/CheY-like chemotaxis protein
MTIARQFYLLVCLPPLLAIAFAVALTYNLGNLTTRGSGLIVNLQRTERISQQLASGNAEAIRLLSAQLQSLDPAFPERLRELDYQLGEKSSEYLKLDIGMDERMAVERIKILQGEMMLLAMQVYRDLESGADRRAAIDLNRAHRVEAQVRDEFDTLSSLQLSSLETVVGHLHAIARRSGYSVAALLVALLLSAVATAVLLRRRVIGPVRDILDASERIRMGDLSARAPASRSDEIGRLTQGFNFMADSLALSYADLERKVAERTTQLQQVQEQLVQAEKLSAIGELVGGVAHELNNPLAAIMGFTELAKTEAAALPDAGPLLRLLDQVDTDVERSRRIVANLLQFARRQEPRIEAFRLNAAVDQMVELRAYQLATRNTRIVRDYDQSDPLLCADRDKVQQVVLNLLNNAHDAITETGRQGTITVTTRAEDGGIVLRVADDGSGFRDPARAFDPFYTTKEIGKGTGLGLSVCYGIVSEHGGRIHAANRDPGAVVTVWLPAGRPEQHPPPSASPGLPVPAAPPEPGGGTVLVVDDEPALLKLQLTFLSRMGLAGHGVASGEEAIRYLENHGVAAIVSDVRMPGRVDGVELYKWVVANRPHVARRFLFASGDLVGLNLDVFFERNDVPRIGKPFRYDAYAKAVLDAISDGGAAS